MRRSVFVLSFFGAALWGSLAFATCPTGGAIEAAIYGCPLTGPPYASSLRIPVAPSATPGALEYFTADTLVDTSTAQTIGGPKTLTNPTINGSTQTGTIAGSPSYSGNPLYTGIISGTVVAGGFLGLDSGNHLVKAAPAGTGNVTGPGSSVNTNFACWNGTSGTLLSDCGYNTSHFLVTTSNLTDLSNVATGRNNLLAATSGGTPTRYLGLDGSNNVVTGTPGGALPTVNNSQFLGWGSGSASGVAQAVSIVAGSGAGFTCSAQTCTITASGAGGGNSITSPNSTLSVGGSPVATTLDVNLSHSNTWLAAQTIPGLTVTSSFTATGLVTNVDLANPSTTVGSTTCTLGSSCATLAGVTLTSPTINGGTMGNSTAWTISSGTPTVYVGLDSSNHMVTGTPAGSGSLAVGSVTGVTNIDPGNGLQATAGATGHANLLLTNTLRSDSTNSPAFASSDAGSTLLLTGSAPALTIPAGGGSGLTTGFGVSSFTVHSGTFKTVTSTINGIAGATGIKLGANQGFAVMVDPSNNYDVLLGLPQPGTQGGTTTLCDDMTWGTCGLGGGAPAFSAITSATNTTAAMVVGTGASMSFAGTSLPTPGAGVLGIAGEATKPTLAANGEGDVWLDSTTGGLGLIGKGSSNDFTLYNSAGTSTCAIATGTTNFACVALQGGAGTGFNLNLATATISNSLPTANRPSARADVGSSTGNVFTAPSGYFICTAACTVTPPVPVAGYQFCVWDLPGTTGAITLANPGTGVMYGKVDFSGYGTATSGTLVSTGAAGDKACIVGKDATHYDTPSSHGSWTAS